MEGAFAIAYHLCEIKGTVLALTELPGLRLRQEQPWFHAGSSLSAQQTASSSGHERWEEEKGTDLFHRINGVTLGVNRLFSDISSSVFRLVTETASYPELCPLCFPSRFRLPRKDSALWGTGGEPQSQTPCNKPDSAYLRVSSTHALTPTLSIHTLAGRMKLNKPFTRQVD